MSLPSRDDIIARMARTMYGPGVLNNTHRGDVVEAMVLEALGPDWNFVGLGWHPWDLQRGSGDERVRIQVKQTAALQVWAPTKKMTLKFNWSESPPSEFERYNPGEAIESEGWFCDVFVFGLHRETDTSVADHMDVRQWTFLVIPITDLRNGRLSMVLSKALANWEPVDWTALPEAVDDAIDRLEDASS